MEVKEEDVKMGANKFSERQPIGTSAQSQDKGWKEPPPAPLFEPGELKSWSFWRVGIVEFSVGPFIGTGFNPVRSLGATIIFNKGHAWDDHWIFWVGTFIGAALALAKIVCLYNAPSI